MSPLLGLPDSNTCTIFAYVICRNSRCSAADRCLSVLCGSVTGSGWRTRDVRWQSFNSCGNWLWFVRGCRQSPACSKSRVIYRSDVSYWHSPQGVTVSLLGFGNKNCIEFDASALQVRIIHQKLHYTGWPQTWKSHGIWNGSGKPGKVREFDEQSGNFYRLKFPVYFVITIFVSTFSVNQGKI